MIIAINGTIIEAFIVHALWYRSPDDYTADRDKAKCRRTDRAVAASLVPEVITTTHDRDVRTTDLA